MYPYIERTKVEVDQQELIVLISMIMTLTSPIHGRVLEENGERFIGKTVLTYRRTSLMI